MKTTIDKILTETCFIKHGISRDERGETTYSKTTRARCVFHSKSGDTVVSIEGRETIISGVLDIENVVDFNNKKEASEYKIIYGGITYTVVNVHPIKTANGFLSHYRVSVVEYAGEDLTI